MSLPTVFTIEAMSNRKDGSFPTLIRRGHDIHYGIYVSFFKAVGRLGAQLKSHYQLPTDSPIRDREATITCSAPTNTTVEGHEVYKCLKVLS